MMNIEACIHCDTRDSMIHSVRAAYAGGAARIELCAAMAQDGLTPSRDFIMAARQHFPRPGILVMIRPRAGHFCYDVRELGVMRSQIDMAAECGADGVVFGALQKNNELDHPALESMLKLCAMRNVQSTFHRAFDATPDKKQTMRLLIDLGVNRILTSGTQWGDGRGAVDAICELTELIECAADRIEIVIGGGVSPENADAIVTALPAQFWRVSLHAYSGIRKNGLTDAALVSSLLNAANKRK